jgi:hypothetical protein
MIVLLISITLFNIISFKTARRISTNRKVHIWIFTCLFQLIFDVFISLKYHGYWYFGRGVDLKSFPIYTLLIPPVNLIFLSWFPFNRPFIKKILYIIIWEIFMLSYEMITTLPSPYGYYQYGWWSLGHSALINPMLLLILINYYKWIGKLEKDMCMKWLAK